MELVHFIKQYVKHPRMIGAIVPSTSFSAKRMVRPINFDNASFIVELGAGTGAFTKELIKRKRRDTVLLIIEVNEEFVSRLKDLYEDEPSVYVIHGSAENVEEYLQQLGIEKVDYVISGLPFASLNKVLSTNILQATTRILHEDGLFITIQYTTYKLAFIGSFFSSLRTEWILWNIPPAYIVICQKGER